MAQVLSDTILEERLESAGGLADKGKEQVMTDIKSWIAARI